MKAIKQLFRPIYYRLIFAYKFKKIWGINILRPIVIFDAGANNGDNFIEAAKLFCWVKVYAFEPTPQLVNLIKYKTKSIKNYKVVPVAIDIESGRKEFNVAGNGDWGCSSLLEFNENINETWADRSDLNVTEIITVDTITLKEFLIEKNISKIDLLHIDTQGNDLKVLQSLENKLVCVRKGIVEVPESVSVQLYKGQHTKQEMLDFLKSKGFKIWRTDKQQNEENIFFKK
jgi:FkbM family methyltransferase